MHENRTITLTRLDGSQFTIQPRCDRVGNQCFKEVIHAKTGEMHLIPEFCIADEILKHARNNHGTDISNILMEIDFEELRNNEEYQFHVANYLLPSSRVCKIVDEYEHYAGAVKLNEEGQLKSEFSRNIVKGLSNARQMYQMLEARRRQEEENTRREEIYANAQNLGTNIKTSHAEDLSKKTFQGDDR